ncbi:hypothetical protein [Wenyingzhuangia sp. IMCC45467]
MQKKLEAELVSIAHSILQMKNRDDLKALKQKAYQTYEKLAVLSYIEDFVRETPQNTKSVEELVEETFSEIKQELVEKAETPVVVVEKTDQSVVEVDELSELVNAEQVDEVLEVDNAEPKEIIEEELFKNTTEEKIIEDDKIDDKAAGVSLDLFARVEDNEEKSNTLQSSLEKEFGTTVSLDVATDMFENATRVPQKKSINDVAMNKKNLQIDLNDRIAFVKHLFDNSQEDFNRVVSQLNTMSSEKEALSFLKMIKKDYNWGGKEIYEDRLMLLIERKFN